MVEMPVVVGYNGRPHAQEALRWAAMEARHRDAPLLVLFAANYPGMVGLPDAGPAEIEPGALDAAREVTAQGVARAAGMLPGLPVTGRTEVTSPAQALLDVSREASLLVLGSRGRGSVLAGLLGSVAFTVAGNTRCPMVVIKQGYGETTAGPGRGVVVGTDGSAAASAAVRFAAGHAASHAAPLLIVCCTGEVSVPAAVPASPRAAAEEILRRARASLAESHPDLPVATRVAEGVPERILVDASPGAGLMVVGSRGRGAFWAMVTGSTACAVIHGAACPVAVVGSPG
jgi:Universal stress protein UspA and related nucleotide-binding proteins